ncbi:hypothetical protein GCM10010412_101360 [Nonomuraea recticatena]|uniref:Uncharacterized protein n=1 Tax=Nonomuraea recticatena TaxID=46178 RepID=A0ABN3TJH3_9ACTN
MLTFVGTVAAVCSMTTDLFGVLEGVPAPLVATPPSTSLTAKTPAVDAEIRGDDRRVWTETVYRVCTNKSAGDVDEWQRCRDLVLHLMRPPQQISVKAGP